MVTYVKCKQPLGFAGLGVGYLIGCIVNYCNTGGQFFFFHPATNTEKTIVDIEENINNAVSVLV